MELLSYLLKVSACTVLFFSFYLVVLRKLTFFRINRFYLLLTLLLSFVIPSLHLEIKHEILVTDINKLNDVSQVKPLSNKPSQMVQPLVIDYGPQEQAKINWNTFCFCAYVGITAMLLLISAWRLFSLLKYAKGFKNIDGLKLISKSVGFTNCSFFNYVFINESILSEQDLSVLLKHEEVHANQFHSIDKMILMICKAVLWFNPVVYLFDQALEQVHEYEADEVTSLNFGTGAYAKLLLKLAISKRDMPLIHNFVKSPVKARIKMLFNSKSNHMKKLNYLLVLPVIIGLFWLFSVQVVYAESQLKSELSYQDTLTRKTSKNKELALPSVKQADPYFSSKDYLEKLTLAQSSNGKTLIGIIKGDYSSEIKLSFDNGKLFESGGQTYVIPKAYLAQNINLLKTGSEFKVVVYSTFFNKGGNFVYIEPRQIFSGKKLIFQMPKPEVYPFLYEANKVRFNDGKISNIISSGSKKIVILNANGYNFKITFNNQQTDLSYLNDYQKGDNVRLRFVHEVKTGSKSYDINDWISISKNLRTFGVQNKILFSKFYKENGHQKVAESKTAAPIITRDIIRAKVISSSKIIRATKNNIRYNQKSNFLVAKRATLKTKAGDKITAQQIIFDLNKNIYSATNSEDEKIEDKFGRYGKAQKDLLENSPSYKATDSLKFSKDKSLIHLYGKAKLLMNTISIDAEEITYNNKTKMGSAKDLVVTQLGSGTKIKGSNANFNLDGKVEIWQNTNGNLVVEP